MNADIDPDDRGTDTTTRAALLADNDPASLLRNLPNAVFPVSATVHLPRVRDDDVIDDRFPDPDTEDVPFEVRRPRGAYIPETVVHFDNPVLRPTPGTTAWRPAEFLDRFETIVDRLREIGTRADGIRLTAVELAEIPEPYITTDERTGDLCAKPELYDDRAAVRLAEFRKEGTLAAAEVREEIEAALPGESRVPVRLARVVEGCAKPSRHGRHTASRGGRARYFTDAEAESVGDLSLTPAVYRLDPDASAERARPLSPMLSHLDDLLPAVAGADPELVTSVKFVGEEREKTVFHASEVLG